MENKLKLYGFNNLTKALSFNIYDVCYAKTEREQLDYIKYIDQQYNSERLTGIMEKLTEMIGAHVLHISKQDYDPQGASVTFLIAEEHMKPALEPDTIVAHLDKSHVTVHTRVPSGHLPCDLSRGHRRGDLRRDHAAVHPRLPHRLVRLGYYHDGLPRARLYPRHRG